MSSLLEPFFQWKEREPALTRLPRESLELMDSLKDFEVSGRSILQSKRIQGHPSFLGSLIQGEDRIQKKGRTIHFTLTGPRRFPVPNTRFALQVKESFDLEFRSASERFFGGDVSNRFEGVLKSMRKLSGPFDPSSVLTAGILPQRPRLLGVETPVHVEIFGVSISLRFLLAFFTPSRIRLFVSGPKVQEIELKPSR